ncbi:unnamed protein product [Dovyalis caffra]|uniref:Oligopeptide transporter OPT superfamily n=1 Tax=Dovyalis caffra TaxID=77055 RepID=A0AAV1QT53_9ROSI|nr:unnamed protein product [Dovyalis caffra]
MGEATEVRAMEIEADEECPVKQVDLTVPKTDDPTMPIAVVPLGHLMARKVTTRMFFEGTSWEFTLNLGPFNVKEHVLITIFANSGAGTVYATHILFAVKLYYKRKLTFVPALFVMVTTQQLGSGLQGLGIGAVGFDWATISSYLGSPLASPCFATANVAIGFFLTMYLMTPICYWLDIYNAKTFSIYSNKLFTEKGEEYNMLKIINSKFHLDREAYAKFGPVHLSTFFAMRPWICHANIITEFIIGCMYPERPVANMCFKVYGYISMTQALTFLADFKPVHYKKIPPRSMFMAQVSGILVYLGTAWWMMDAIPDLCGRDNGRGNAPWTGCFLMLLSYGGWLDLAESLETSVNMEDSIGSFLRGLYRTEQWKRYNYVLSSRLDAGTAFMTVDLFCSRILECWPDIVGKQSKQPRWMPLG